MTQLILLGGGGHAREIADVVARLHIPPDGVCVFVEPDWFDAVVESRWRARGVRVVQDLWSVPPTRFVGAVGDPGLRRRLVAHAEDAGHEPASVLSPEALISPSAALEPGAVVFWHAAVSSDVVLGPHVHLNQGARVSHDATVGAFATLGPGALVTGAAQIGADAVLGAGAVVLPGRHVGEGATVGAGAVVVADVAAGTVVAGNPARLVRDR